MATIRQTKNKKRPWIVDYQQGGERQRPSFANRREAEDFKRELLLRPLDQMTRYQAVKTKPVGAAIADYKESFSRHKSQSTFKNECRWFNELRDFCATKRIVMLADITKHDLDQYRSVLRTRMKNSSVNRMFNLYFHFFAQSDSWGYLRENPAGDMSKLAEEQTKRKVWTNEQIEKFTEAVSPWARTCYEMLAATGARVSSVVGMLWGDVDEETRILNLRTRKDKGGQTKTYEVPITPVIAELLAREKEVARRAFRYAPDRHVFVNASGKPISATHLCRHAGKTIHALALHGLTLNGLRHTVLTRSANIGGVHHAQMIAGHSNLKTTQGYLHPDREELRETLGKVMSLGITGHRK